MEVELLYTSTEASTIILLISLVAMLILPLFGLLSDKVGRRLSFVLSAVVGLIATVMLGLFTIITPVRDFAVAALFIIPAGFGSHALFGVWASEMFPTHSRAAATSVIFSLARGLSFGGWFVGILAAMVGLSYGMMLAIIGFVLMVVLPWTLPETAGRDLGTLEQEETA